MPVRSDPLVVPLPPVATTVLLMSRLNTPGSLAGTVTFLSSTVGLQAGELDDAVASIPVSRQTRLVLEASNSVVKSATVRPGLNSVGWPRPGWLGGKNLFWSPIGTF